MKVLGPDGTTELANTLLTRPIGGNLVSTASIDVTAGVNRLVDIGAYSESGVLVASGSAKVDVASSTETAVAVVLIPTAVPSISGVSPPNGGPGAEIQLAGANFLVNGGFPTIRFTGGATVSPTAFSDALLKVSVPNGVLSGLVVVAVDGIEATSSAPFTLLGSLLLTPSATSGVATGSQVAFTLSGRDTANSPVEGASASLAIVEIRGSDENPASYSAAVAANVVTLTPRSSGAWEIKATSGTLTATASLQAQ